MKICIIAWKNPVECGLSATHVWEAAKDLTKFGKEIHMVVPKIRFIITAVRGI